MAYVVSSRAKRRGSSHCGGAGLFIQGGVGVVIAEGQGCLSQEVV